MWRGLENKTTITSFVLSGCSSSLRLARPLSSRRRRGRTIDQIRNRRRRNRRPSLDPLSSSPPPTMLLPTPSPLSVPSMATSGAHIVIALQGRQACSLVEHVMASGSYSDCIRGR
ncbi:hypothetical protein SETIT_5G178700v2 [Setaria italica]|uniref:Uncharacterized protein n=1 Tax=Setaria italica TaxID=4555 RepID=A0A368R7Q3_SETIT|nr:hypothetical protein SETIT_5G178700v2 [Setaria italica]